jgi:flavin reductase ActVB
MEMTTNAALHQLFLEAMTSLASGVAVVTARKPSGDPCGLAVTAVTSYSAHPPSLLVSIAHVSRCHEALTAAERFGVHILRSNELALAHRFADREAEDKFGGLDWSWDGEVPELAGTLAYLRCRRAANFTRYDHTVVIGDLETGRLEAGEPLLYARRRMDWLLRRETE